MNLWRTRGPRRGWWRAPGRRKRIYHVMTLREIIPKHVCSWPRTASEIFQDVRNDYGEVTDRTLYRTLTKLVDAGVIEHVGTKHGGRYQTRIHETA